MRLLMSYVYLPLLIRRYFYINTKNTAPYCSPLCKIPILVGFCDLFFSIALFRRCSIGNKRTATMHFYSDSVTSVEHSNQRWPFLQRDLTGGLLKWSKPTQSYADCSKNRVSTACCWHSTGETSKPLCAHTLKRFNKLKTDNNVFTVLFWWREGAADTRLFSLVGTAAGLSQCPAPV